MYPPRTHDFSQTDSEIETPARPAFDWSALRVMGLQAMGAKARRCLYCASTIAVGEVRCDSCGAAVTAETPTIEAGNDTGRPWALPLMLCFLFPPALLVVGPVLFWRWLRKANRGWLIPALVCLFFPPAVFLVAPALLWRRQPGA